jgi:hypothetical protein
MSRLVERLGVLLLTVTLATTGVYVFVYLYRWEWNRAIVSGVLFVAAEVALVGWRLATRLAVVDRRLDALEVKGYDQRLERIRQTAPEPIVNFRWLSRPDRLGVFIPVLMGAGVVMSALAWAVERLARATAQPVAEHSLARRLQPLSLPPAGFLGRADDGLEMLRGPLVGRRR